MIKCPECGADMDSKKPCPECGHEINAPKPSNDGLPPIKVPEDPMGQENCDKCGKPMVDGKCSDSCGSKPPKATKDACGKKAKVDGTPNTCTRVDYWGELNTVATSTEAMKTTENGFLKGKAAIFGVGVYRYKVAGGVQAEFRPPEEVFSEETLDSFELLPLTNDHPPEKVTPDNYGKYAVGSLGEEIEHDAYNAFAELTINKADAIEAVKNGRTGLSGGYACEVVTSGEVSYPVMGWNEDYTQRIEVARTTYKIPGNFNGTPYDAIQIGIRGNHVALVDVPRGGDALHLRFDGADVGVGIRVPGNETTPQPTGENMKKIKLDGAQEHEIPEAVADHIDGLVAKVAQAEASAEAAKAKADAAEASVEALKADAAEFPAKVQEAVTSRLALVAKADSMGVKVSHEDSEEAIQKAVVTQAMPTVKVDELDAVKLDAYFVAACDLLTVKKADSGVQGQLQQVHGKQDAEDKVDGSDWSAYQQNFRK